MGIDAEAFHKISKDIFYPIYPVIVDDIVNRSRITKGECLDIGGGTGSLGMALAKKTDMNVCIYDISSEMLEIAKKEIKGKGLENKVEIEVGAAENIDRVDNSIDMVISRGSIFFWDDKVKGMNEIYRVLKKGGFAYVGGGFGSEELANEIDQKMLVIDSNWLVNKKKRRMENEDLAKMMERSVVDDFEIVAVGTGLWIVFTKK